MNDSGSRLFVAKAWLLKQVTAVLATLSRNRLPPIPATAAIIERDNQLLMIERSDGLGYALPGGIMRWNESIEDTVRREVREETGYNVKVLGHFKNYSGPERDKRFSSLSMAYTARILDGQLTSSNEGRPLWVACDKVLDLNLAFDARQMIADYLAQR